MKLFATKFRQPAWFKLSYIVDWLITIAIVIVTISVTQLANIDPHERFLPTAYQEGQYPGQTELVPIWLLLLGCLVVPILMFVLFQIALRSLHDLHHTLLGFSESISLTLFFTCFTQIITGEYSPDWYSRERTGSPLILREGRLSFPSLHSSLAFCTLFYLSLYLTGKLGVFKRGGGQMWKVLVLIGPIVIACLVAVSRTIDYHNNFVDIVTGSIIGSSMATFSYFLNFSSLMSEDCDMPKDRIMEIRKQRRHRKGKEEEEEGSPILEIYE